MRILLYMRSSKVIAYEKLTQDLVFDNTKMLNTCPTSLSLSRGGRAGFTPKHTLQTIYNPQITAVPSAGATGQAQINADSP